MQWLRDGLKIIGDAAETESLSREADESQRVILVPAFAGLGAPHWDSRARGAMFGLTRATGPREFARAALDAVCLQTADLAGAMEADFGGAAATMRIDGGMAANDFFAQRLSDLMNRPAERPKSPETTTAGAAYLAAMHAGLQPPPERFAEEWKADRRFSPEMPESERDKTLSAWRDAVERTKGGAFGD